MSEHPVYVASEWQNKFHSRTEWEVLGGGAAGPGKSMCLLMDPMQQVMVEHNRCSDKSHPNHIRWGSSTGKTLYVMREFPMLEETIARSERIFPMIDPGADYKSSDKIWTFSSGYKYRFGHLHEPGDWIKYYSNEYTQLCFDELRMLMLEQYEQLSGRVRSSDPVLRKMLKVRSMTNPGPCMDPLHPQWVRERFVDPDPEGNVVLKRTIKRRDGTTERRDRLFLKATLYDNPDKEFVANYETTLLSLPAHIRQLQLYGNWYAAVGAFFGEDWDPDVHVVDPFEVPSDWPIFRSMDWGYRTPGTIGWYARDYEGNLFKIKEFSFKEMTAPEVAEAVREWETNNGLWKRGKSTVTGPADTQLWEKRGESGLSKAEEFSRLGVPWVPADKSSRARNAEHVTSRLKSAKQGKSGGVYVFRQCVKLIQTLPIIMSDENNSEVPAKGGDDHWYDEFSYAMRYASKPFTANTRSKADREDDWFGGSDVEHSRRGQYGYGGA